MPICLDYGCGLLHYDWLEVKIHTFRIVQHIMFVVSLLCYYYEHFVWSQAVLYKPYTLTRCNIYVNMLGLWMWFTALWLVGGHHSVSRSPLDRYTNMYEQYYFHHVIYRYMLVSKCILDWSTQFQEASYPTSWMMVEANWYSKRYCKKKEISYL